MIKSQTKYFRYYSRNLYVGTKEVIVNVLQLDIWKNIKCGFKEKVFLEWILEIKCSLNNSGEVRMKVDSALA